MKVLFVSSGNFGNGLSPIIINLANSLRKLDVAVEHFSIKGHGFWAYIKSIFLLKKHLNINGYDIIHSHYSLSSYVATLALSRPLIVSLMGSDVLSSRRRKLVLKMFKILFWKITIVKTEEMFRHLNSKGVEIVPNGVDLDHYNPQDQIKCMLILNWNLKSKHLVFISDPSRPEKNFSLVEESLKLLGSYKELELHVVKDVSLVEMPLYYNAADLLLLTSLYEGSPNVIKEAMACNCPIVSTDVGDIKWVIGNTNGCYLTGFEPADVVKGLEQALDFGKRTNGRNRIIELKLDSLSSARRHIELYETVIASS